MTNKVIRCGSYISKITRFLKKHRWIIVSVTFSISFALNINFGFQLNSKVDFNHLTTFKNEVINIVETKTTSVTHNENVNQNLRSNNNTTNTINTNENKNVNLTTRSFNYTDEDKKLLVDYMKTYLAEKTKNIEFYQNLLNAEWIKLQNASDEKLSTEVNKRINSLESIIKLHEIDREYMQDNLMYFFNNLIN